MIFHKEIELNIEMNEEEIDKKIEEINKKLPNAMEKSNYYIEENNLVITKGKAGVQLETEKFKNILKNTIEKEEDRKFIIPVKEVFPEEINLEKIHDEIYKETQNLKIILK